MSQHIFKTKNTQGELVTVTMGYDRPLDYVFCTVMGDDSEIIYSNLDDEDAGTEQQNVDYFRCILGKLGLQVPERMFQEVTADQRAHVGNRDVTHVADE